MPCFSQSDFTPENATRLSVIIMPKINRYPLTSFKTLPETQKKKFNKIMNEYIRSLGENWEEALLADFNTVVNEDILNEEFDPSKQFVPEMNSNQTLLLNEEQKNFFKENPEELKKITGEILEVEGN
jgi:hypothetical protein